MTLNKGMVCEYGCLFFKQIECIDSKYVVCLLRCVADFMEILYNKRIKCVWENFYLYPECNSCGFIKLCVILK